MAKARELINGNAKGHGVASTNEWLQATLMCAVIDDVFAEQSGCFHMLTLLLGLAAVQFYVAVAHINTHCLKEK